MTRLFPVFYIYVGLLPLILAQKCLFLKGQNDYYKGVVETPDYMHFVGFCDLRSLQTWTICDSGDLFGRSAPESILCKPCSLSGQPLCDCTGSINFQQLEQAPGLPTCTIPGLCLDSKCTKTSRLSARNRLIYRCMQCMTKHPVKRLFQHSLDHKLDHFQHIANPRKSLTFARKRNVNRAPHRTIKEEEPPHDVVDDEDDDDDDNVGEDIAIEEDPDETNVVKTTTTELPEKDELELEHRNLNLTSDITNDSPDEEEYEENNSQALEHNLFVLYVLSMISVTFIK